jgi:hypothetical protein
MHLGSHIAINKELDADEEHADEQRHNRGFIALAPVPQRRDSVTILTESKARIDLMNAPVA